MAKNARPIGIFDSGIGGLTIANAINVLLPNEKLVYFGDTAHLPYGDKSADAIRYFSIRIAKFLLEKNCKAIVIACNSASSTAFNTLIDFYGDDIPFINVIDPLVQLVLESTYKNVGVIGTKATIRSDVYASKLRSNHQDIKVHQQETPLLAPMIEEGFHNNEVSKTVIANYLSNEAFESIDAILLACTHYPLIKEEIIAYYDNRVKVLDPNATVASKLKQVLESGNMLSAEKGTHDDEFYVSDLTDSFKETTKLFYGRNVDLQEVAIWK